MTTAPAKPNACDHEHRTLKIDTHMSSLIKIQSKQPGIHLNFNLSPAEIQKNASALLDTAKRILGEIADIPEKDRTFDNIVSTLGIFEGHLSTISSSLYFPQYIAVDKETRNAAVSANKLIEDFNVEMSMRSDLYQSVLTIHKRIDEDKEYAACLSDIDRRLVKKMIETYERNGLLFPQPTQDKLKATKKRLSALSIDFSSNINEDATHCILTKGELNGCTEDFFGSLQKVAERDGVPGEYFKVTMKYPDYFGVLKYCKKESTRMTMENTYSSRCTQNTAILLEAIKLRQEYAVLSGYTDHAHFVLFEKMAKTPQNVEKFLDDLAVKLKPLASAEREVLTNMKREETGDATAVLNPWDFHYFNRKLEEKFAVNEEEIKEYFEFNNVTRGMLDIYEKVLSLKFKEIKHDESTWHSDVQLFQVLNACSSKTDSSSVVGYFYLDLFPRDGKYTHAACFPLQPAFQLGDGNYQLPTAVMVANFTKPTATNPSLLKHDEVVTYFHELGHVMHHVCSKTKYAKFHGTNVEGDFVEAPSQMLENWCWDKATLQSLSKHYKDKGKVLPYETVDALIKTKLVNVGLFYLRQIFFGKFDMTIHTKCHEWTADSLIKFWKTLRTDLTGFVEPPTTFGGATFGHLMGGYDAGYYGYLWSLVISADLYYSRFAHKGVLNPATGLDYREKILLPGAGRDAKDMIVGFLGREPTQDAFLKSLGLTA